MAVLMGRLGLGQIVGWAIEGSSFRFWYDRAIAFLLGESEEKPLPWQKA
jgi:hypothetical protein